jgi:hypothetical protein
LYEQQQEDDDADGHHVKILAGTNCPPSCRNCSLMAAEAASASACPYGSDKTVRQEGRM